LLESESASEVAAVLRVLSDPEDELERFSLICDRMAAAGTGEAVLEPRRRGLKDRTSSSFSLVLSAPCDTEEATFWAEC
jgi:hypothetical protein